MQQLIVAVNANFSNFVVSNFDFDKQQRAIFFRKIQAYTFDFFRESKCCK